MRLMKPKKIRHDRSSLSWQLMSEGPRLSHFFMSLIWSEVFKGGYHAKFTRGYQTPDFVWYSDSEEGLHAEYRTKEWMSYAKKIGMKNFLDEAFFEDYLAEIDRYCRIADKIAEELDYSLRYSRKDLLSISRQIIPVYKQLIGSIFSNWPEYTEGLSEGLMQILKKKVPKNKVTKVFVALTHPESMSEFTTEEIDFLQLIHIIRKRIKNPEKFSWSNIHKSCPELNRLIINHYKKYRLISASDRTEAWTKKELYLRISHYLKSGRSPMKKREDMINKYLNIKKEKEDIVFEYRLPEKSLLLGSRIATIGFYRFKASFAWRQLGYFFVLVFRRYAEENNVSFEMISSLKINEFFSFLKGKSLFDIVSEQELAKRAIGELFYVRNHKSYFYFGTEAIIRKDKILGSTNYDLKYVKGEIGNTGFVRGKAFVFRWNDRVEHKFSRMPKDAVLIVPQTHPAYLPVIRKAKAIVSDEGGVTGHAAIVSRELGKPCVIGTHIGTKVFKTGDLVEVDANRGIVRKL